MERSVGRKARKRKRRSRVARWFASVRKLQWNRLLRWTPGWVKVVAAVLVLAVVSIGVNWVYQVYRKPTELFFPLSGSFYKDPARTWTAYGALFREHSTPVMTPTFLAALAQVEGSGNPIVRTYWRLAFTTAPFEIYRPASSAVGMYQITDGTFAEARRYCIHDHEVASDDAPWYSLRGCWFNSLYMRTVPSDAIELTSAYLDRARRRGLRSRRAGVALREKQTARRAIHLCGPGVAGPFVRRALRRRQASAAVRTTLRAYLERVESMERLSPR